MFELDQPEAMPPPPPSSSSARCAPPPLSIALGGNDGARPTRTPAPQRVPPPPHTTNESDANDKTDDNDSRHGNGDDAVDSATDKKKTPANTTNTNGAASNATTAAATAAATAGTAATELGSLGDIMAPATTYLKLPDGFTPLQRMLLTANGNVERIVASYYAAPVTTYVSLNHKREHCVYDRQIALLVFGQQFMSAKSTIFFTDIMWHEQMLKRNLQPGVLYRSMGEMPTFNLRSVGKGPSYFWRTYTLSASGMTVEVTETFAEDVFDKWPGQVPHATPVEIKYSVSL